MVASAISYLVCRLNAYADFTYSDVVILTLIDIVNFPIKFEHTYCMVIFNNQYYDFQDFVLYRPLEYVPIEKRKDSNYLTQVQFKDLRTGEDFEFRYTPDDLWVRQMTTL